MAEEVTDLLLLLTERSFQHLRQFDISQLNTKIFNKNYVSFMNAGASSRPVNSLLFRDLDSVKQLVDTVKSHSLRGGLSSAEITCACYTLVVSFACVIDLTNRGDKQSPGTLFEYLIKHLLSRDLGMLPSERIRVKIGEATITLTMDLIFDLSITNRKLHVAVKTSTRERGSEFWAHQRILDQAFEGEFVGVFIGLGETKLKVYPFVKTAKWGIYQWIRLLP